MTCMDDDIARMQMERGDGKGGRNEWSREVVGRRLPPGTREKRRSVGEVCNGSNAGADTWRRQRSVGGE
jgi:hypothetical protein